MLSFVTTASVKLIQRYLPSPFVFAISLSLIALAASILVTGQSLPAMAKHWGTGFWNLLTFSMQMSLMLVTGHALASAPAVHRLLAVLTRTAHTPGRAVVMVTLVGLVGSWFNWGFGLVVGAIFARALAREVKGVDYPLLVAAAYSGFLVAHAGLSASIPLSLATGGPDLVLLTGGVVTDAIGVSETLFTTLNLTIVALLAVGVPILNRAMHPKTPTVIDPSLLMDPEDRPLPRETPAQRLDDSLVLNLFILALGAVYFGYYFSENGLVVTLNIMIGLFLFIGLALHGSPERYMRAVQHGIGGISGIVLQFPFYAGIMGLMAGANADGVSLGREITEIFVAWSTADTFPMLTFLSAGLVNMFVPSGGGQWAVQGPIMLPAGQALGVAPAVTALAIGWGDAWTNMIQPFWALPVLGIVGLGARDIMGYCLLVLVFSGLVIAGCFYFFQLA